MWKVGWREARLDIGMLARKTLHQNSRQSRQGREMMTKLEKYYRDGINQ